MSSQCALTLFASGKSPCGQLLSALACSVCRLHWFWQSSELLVLTCCVVRGCETVAVLYPSSGCISEAGEVILVYFLG